MTNATSSGKKAVKYTDEQLFVWMQGEKGLVPQIWNKDFEEAYGGKKRKPLFRVSIGDSKETLEQLVEKYPAPITGQEA